MSVNLYFATEYLKAFTGYHTTFRILPCYLALSTTIPNADGSNFTEPPASRGYGRVMITSNNDTVFGDVVVLDGTAMVANNTPILRYIATGSWGRIRAIGLFATLQDTVPYVFAPLEESIDITTDELPVISIGELTITIGCENGRVNNDLLPGAMGFFTGVNANNPLGDKCYLGLSLTEPNADGSNFTEPEYAYGYSRMILGEGEGWRYHAISFAQSVGNGSYYVFNDKEIEFPQATALWGTLTHFGLFSSLNATARPLVWGRLSTAVTIERNHVPLFKYGAFSLWLK